MMARRGVMGVLAGGLALALSGCGSLFPARYRFRLTVEVETPQGLRTGSSVYEVKAWNEPGMDPSGKVRKWSVRGEAIAVDLPGDRVLFALLKTAAHFGDMAGLSMSTLYPAFRAEGYDVVGVARELAREDSRNREEVARKDYPMLVTFRDLTNPATVELADPNDLAAAFGTGVRLKHIIAEKTDDPVAHGIERRLAWLPSHVGSLVRRPTNLPIGEMPIEQRLNSTDFRSGDGK